MKSIEDTSTFLLFMKECAKRVGQLLNLAAIAKACGIAANTAKAWLEVLEKGYMVYRLPPHPESFGKRVVKVPKLYFYDTGLLCYLLEIKEANELDQHEAFKMIAENYLLNEIVKSFYHRGESASSLYFWRDLRGKEVDCLIEHGGKLRAIDFQPFSTTELEIDFRGMEHWQKLSKYSMFDSVIVYGGKAVNRQTNSSMVFSWQDALSVTNGILIRDLAKFYKDLKKKI
ncbi:MAG: DUF4143 domain-containing protein [Ignavibacteria bacterium]|nr:DUF4143 domain-containing protein [Ignavibacteria bacterium]